jgi:hypothetical protein
MLRIGRSGGSRRLLPSVPRPNRLDFEVVELHMGVRNSSQANHALGEARIGDRLDRHSIDLRSDAGTLQRKAA